ncbi:MAG: YidH family protein [Betaproteobacteria bacterium]
MTEPASRTTAKAVGNESGGEAKASTPAAGAATRKDVDETVRSIMNRIEGVVADSLGLAPHERDLSGLDASTRLAHERTDLGLDRTYMAGERTLQAWIRTALSMISFGFTIGKLGEVLRGTEITGMFRREWSIGSIAYALVVLGTLALFGACVQHVIQVRRLRAQGLRNQPSIAFVVAILLTFVGGFAFTALVLQL